MLRAKNGLLEDIAADVGYTATTTLVDYFGGTSIYIPNEAKETHAIAKLIGISAFNQLVKNYGSTTINLPLDFQRERSQRNRLIAVLIMQGRTTKQIARLCGLTPRNISYIRIELEMAGILKEVASKKALLSAKDKQKERRLKKNKLNKSQLKFYFASD